MKNNNSANSKMREMLELTDKNFKTAMKNASVNHYDFKHT